MHFLGTEWSLPVLANFGRGKPRMEASAFPSSESLLAAWTESGHALSAALDQATDDLLAQAATQGPPSLDGKISGIVNFMAYHETYHVGQASYLRAWLGHKGLMG